ncbi:acetyltransferase [Ramlibacter sp. RBP-2]|uniref:Acetyltransferase n=1 Tax=Ramlibacter lithotrophicus TaxID=2606681 RepID=A0A7X6DEJ7_9BURK|nr:acetyltransferase [Ramlibacter lithotrophicus]NKE65701.1 acetyltransferase [Ramlibacter lithotrophicus]
MSHHDVFNGDADGICALHQLRLAAPRDSQLVTGTKRDIELLARVAAQPGDSVTVLDVSLDRNRAGLLRLLAQGVAVEYFDHHFAGVIPRHAGLTAHIDPAPGECTSTIVDRHLRGRHRLWAIVAAFGDHLEPAAARLAQEAGLAQRQADLLRELGQAINYNAYGETEADLLLRPADLYRALQPFADPFDFVAGHDAPRRLGQARRDDLALAHGTPPVWHGDAGSVTVLPDAAWARRVQGEFANELAARAPERAHALLCQTKGGWRVSVRAPLARPRGADELCRRFPGGGGRAEAAGVDLLPREGLGEFIDAFARAFPAAP